jgi:hypothetical protein
MEENKEYILFLRENDISEGKQYTIKFISFGKYNTSKEEWLGLSRSTISTNSNGDVVKIEVSGYTGYIKKQEDDGSLNIITVPMNKLNYTCLYSLTHL